MSGNSANDLTFTSYCLKEDIDLPSTMSPRVKQPALWIAWRVWESASVKVGFFSFNFSYNFRKYHRRKKKTQTGFSLPQQFKHMVAQTNTLKRKDTNKKTDVKENNIYHMVITWLLRFLKSTQKRMTSDTQKHRHACLNFKPCKDKINLHFEKRVHLHNDQDCNFN